MAWRRAESLDVLEAEVHTVSPQTTIYDIGDAAHQAEKLDHNPNAEGVVCAIDIMQGHTDLTKLAEQIRTSGHPDLAYLIWNHRIATRKNGLRWTPYGGSNPHTDHIHVSVGQGVDGSRKQPYDDTTPWGVAPPTVEDDDMFITSFAGEEHLYGVPGTFVDGLPVLVPLSGPWPKVEQWIKAGVRKVDSGVKLDRSFWHVTEVDAWPASSGGGGSTAPTHEELVQAAFEGAQRAERE